MSDDNGNHVRKKTVSGYHLQVLEVGSPDLWNKTARKADFALVPLLDVASNDVHVAMNAVWRYAHEHR